MIFGIVFHSFHSKVPCQNNRVKPNPFASIDMEEKVGRVDDDDEFEGLLLKGEDIIYLQDDVDISYADGEDSNNEFWGN